MSTLIVRHISDSQPYQPIWEKMQEFTDSRSENTPDEIWLLEHAPVFTQGLAGKPEHILNLHNIPIVQTDRGGQVTYHGPGQLMIYTLFDLNRLKLHTRPFVRLLEQTILDYLATLQITAMAKPDAPGVYVNDAKICSIGLRVRNGYSYHGLAFNVAMDLTPFSYINPCGFSGLAMTQVRDFTPSTTLETVKADIIPHFTHHFRYNQVKITS